jgi:hypothetical protein
MEHCPSGLQRWKAGWMMASGPPSEMEGWMDDVLWPSEMEGWMDDVPPPPNPARCIGGAGSPRRPSVPPRPRHWCVLVGGMMDWGMEGWMDEMERCMDEIG